MPNRSVEQLELECRRQQILNQVLLEALPLGVCVVNSDGLISSLNTGGARVLGWSESSVLGKSCHDIIECLVEQKGQTEAVCPITAVMQDRSFVWASKSRLRCRNGDWKWVELTATVLESFGRTDVLLTFRDLRAEIQLADDFRRLASIPEESPFPIVEVDEACNLQYANPAMVSLMEQADVTGEGFSGALPSGFSKLVKDCLTQDIMEGDVEVRVGEKQFSWLFSPHPELGLVRGFGIEITDRKQAADELSAFADALECKNQELDQALIRAEAATQAKAAFLATMSHEIRTPLNGVIGMTDILIESHLDAQQRDCADIVKSSAEALLIIINDILDFSKIEAGKLRIETIPFDLRSLIEEVIDLFAERAQKHGLDLAGLVQPDMPSVLQGDPTRLRQILSNFIGNAIKFTSQGEILVRIEKIDDGNPEDHGLANEENAQTQEAVVDRYQDTEVVGSYTPQVIIKFSVQDTGIGIQSDTQNRLFQAFSQADVSTTRKYGGTGLGLAICRQLTELMGGTIGVESTPGGGATFWCQIPLGQAESGAASRSLEEEGFGNPKVLLVGCPPATRVMLRTTLESVGATVAETPECSQARAWLRQATEEGTPFDHVLLDGQVPEPTRQALIHSLKDDPCLQSLNIILLVPFWWNGNSVSGQRPEIHSIMAKPIRRTALFALLRSKSEHDDHAAAKVQHRATSGRFLKRNPEKGATEIANQTTRPSILVAEDNPINERVVNWILAKLGCRVTNVSNGREAIEAFSRESFDLILLDWQMPDLDGLQATRIIRAQEAAVMEREASMVSHEAKKKTGVHLHVPIIGVTANVMKGDREQCLKAGMDDWLPKPICAEQLKAILLQWLPSNQADKNDTQRGSEETASQIAVTKMQVSRNPEHYSSMSGLQDRTSGDVAEMGYDINKALKGVEGDWQLLHSLIHLFLESGPQLMAELRQALHSRQWETLKKGAHQLKGSLGALQAAQASAAASTVERLTESADYQQVSAAFDSLDRHFTAMLPVLKKVLEQGTESQVNMAHSSVNH